ncbi:hypothetical protein BGZ99_000990 [Dissophora globulifera]|uniref:Zn(2)-C6 fungal-type domain-containing protein n=1 Tax=Dissophora globulifera TaxID=979702 RepID=A0A9P6R274_9FUNG|nr:hypothetical protein BGZ99_000990 [Dissophora globulifera]
MATSTLQLLSTAGDIVQLDQASLSGMPAVAYDLKRLKVYSSCLRCRAKKVKCDRKEPCSRCEKHSVECSYRELASVQLDIRQFQRHLNYPKVRKDGAGFISSTATLVVAPSPSSSPSISSSILPSSTTASSASKTSPVRSTVYSNHSDRSNYSTPSPSLPSIPAIRNEYDCPHPDICGGLADNGLNAPMSSAFERSTLDRSQVHKVHRRRPSIKITQSPSQEDYIQVDHMRMDITTISEHVDRVKLSDSGQAVEEDSADIPIWHAQAVGKHKQTVHEQDLAETFGLAAYLKAKETEMSQDPNRTGQTIDYEIELERALAQRMPSSFSRPDRSFSRAQKYGQLKHHSAAPYARPSHCPLSSHTSSASRCHNNSNSYNNNYESSECADLAQPPSAAQCCCQISALQGQELSSCPYSNKSHSGYERPATSSSATISPSSSCSSIQSAETQPSLLTTTTERTESAWARVGSMPARVAESSKLQVGRDGEEGISIECKYNEPNVDAWDMIEMPISRTIPLTTKRGRSIKMEMGWILS